MFADIKTDSSNKIRRCLAKQLIWQTSTAVS